MTKKKKVCIAMIVVIMIVVVVSLVFYLNYMSRVNKYQKTVSNMTFTNINISKIPNGTYVGDCDVNFIYAKVSVTVTDGVIVNIELLEHKNGKGAPAEKITDEIIQKQRLDVDAISGATNSSKVIIKAVENALINPL